MTPGSSAGTTPAAPAGALATGAPGRAEDLPGAVVASPGICRCEAIQACCEGLTVPETALEAALGAWATERRP